MLCAFCWYVGAHLYQPCSLYLCVEFSHSACAASVRLVSSSGSTLSGNTGLLQMNVGGVWKYVCDDHFDSNNNGANVACRELGYASGAHSHGTAPVDSFYDNVACTGTESSLVNCPRSASENCGTSEAVTLTCTGT